MSENENNNDVPATDGGHADHPKPKYDDVNIPVVVLLGILSAILTFVSIAFVQGLYFSWQESIVMADWNSRVLTPQEQTIVDQKEVRDGFFETKDGKVFVSVETAARKMIGGTSKSPAPSEDKKQPAEKKSDSQPKPPGPEEDESKKDSNSEPKKDESESKSKEEKDSDSKSPVTKGDSKTGDNK